VYLAQVCCGLRSKHLCHTQEEISCSWPKRVQFMSSAQKEGRKQVERKGGTKEGTKEVKKDQRKRDFYETFTFIYTFWA